VTIFFQQELEGVATFWRIYRTDGVTLGFTSHDRALVFNGVKHRAAPGMQPTAIRRSSGLQSDDAEASGALTHDTISEQDLAAGLYDNARILVGAVNWETLEHETFYVGRIGAIEDDGVGFTANLLSEKSRLETDLVPRTSPTCRAQFCDKQCGQSATLFSRRAAVESVDLDANSVRLDVPSPSNYASGELRFLDGPQTGIRFGIMAAVGSSLILDKPLHPKSANARSAYLREGCDHTIATCNSRFGNAVNFRGEPFLPGNDLLARYPTPL